MRRITPDMPREVAARIALEESSDLKARWLLIDLAEDAYNRRVSECATLVHAYAYLEDREGYERAPWPKGMVKFTRMPCKHAAIRGRKA